jgi:excisionase family DNA binding protein
MPEDEGMSTDTPEVLTVEQTADLLQVSTRTVLQLARDAQLPGNKVGRSWRFCKEDILAYVRGDRIGGRL